MKAQGSPRKDWASITPEAFARFLEWLSPDKGDAGIKYEEVRRKIARYFVYKRVANADELVDKTMDQAVRTINAGGEYPNALALCYGIARNIWLENLKKPAWDPLPIEDLLPSPLQQTEKREQESRCLDACLARLDKHDRDLIKRYYQEQGQLKINIRAELASENGGAVNLRLKAFRIRGRLRDCIVPCLQQSITGGRV
jgi:DNA-directed RNA polymerase specialized sigma24 family protein